MVNKYIFREYDIRGKVVDDFPPNVVTLLGRSFGTFVKDSQVLNLMRYYELIKELKKCDTKNSGK